MTYADASDSFGRFDRQLDVIPTVKLAGLTLRNLGRRVLRS